MHATGTPGDRPAMPANPPANSGTMWAYRAVQHFVHAGKALAPPRILLVALAVGLSFAAVDGLRSFSEAQRTLTVMAELAAVQMSPLTAAAPRPASDALDLAGRATIVVAADGTVLASDFAALPEGALFEPQVMPRTDFWASASLGDGYGEVVIALPGASVTLPVFVRSAVIMLTAAIAAILVLRAVPAPAAPTPPRGSRGDETEQADWLDDVPYGVARWNPDGKLVSANAAFFRLLRLEPDAVPTGAPYSAVSRRIAGRISARPVLDQTHQRVVDVEREDGTSIMLDERECPDGGFISTVTDVTDRRVADKMLANIREEQRQLARRYHEEKIRAEAASRAKTVFLAHLSHDVRTPLNHIIGFADLMQLETYGPLGDRRYADYLCDIRNSGERLLSAFAQILEYAELEGGRKVLNVEPVAIEALVETTAARFREPARRGGIHLNIVPVAPLTVSADRQGLERMLDNLIDNAIRFTPRGGEVRIAAWAGGNGLIIEVADTGVGIAEDQLEKLAQPFALSDASFTKTSIGAGLGLAIARTIAELSGGRLAISSAAGVGTTVAVSLPLIDNLDLPRTFEPARAA